GASLLAIRTYRQPLGRHLAWMIASKLAPTKSVATPAFADKATSAGFYGSLTPAWEPSDFTTTSFCRAPANPAN
ncbi:hypothetical protein, partial [Pseudomonas jinjuensis]